jgi:hypothetical protein
MKNLKELYEFCEKKRKFFILRKGRITGFSRQSGDFPSQTRAERDIYIYTIFSDESGRFVFKDCIVCKHGPENQPRRQYV